MAATLAVPRSAAAGAWSPEPGHGYVKLWFKYLYGFDYAAGDGNIYGYGQYHEAFLAAYAEMGLVDRVALVLHSDLVRTFHLEDPREGQGVQSHFTPGDPYLGARVQFLQVDRLAMSAEVGVRAPFARPGAVQTLYSTDDGNPAVGALMTGTGVWDVPLTLSVGYGFDDWYLSGSAGYVMRTEGFDHALTWSVEGGANLREEGFGFRGRVVGYHSLDVFFDEGAERTDSPSGINNGTSYLGFAVEGDVQVEPGWFVGATVEGGLGLLIRQTGGPVVTGYVANRF